MSLSELIPAVRALPFADKLSLIQALTIDLAEDEGIPPLQTDATYAVWSPHDAYQAASILLGRL
jgi:hypothetical protein